ncbi:MAG: hypothetical protein UU09_C0016G0004 [Microgenomates group bacterium GW2011_GWA2_40_6]|nr:MAG: hypothetical protein UU09_C0016G0004 [Microgenomates group bacterium GW2011_GWA2_40_6]
MYWQTIDSNRKDLLAKLGFLKDLGFYMAGGTALALQIGHRESVDFDFYNEKKFNADNLVSKIKEVAKSLEIEVPDIYSVMGMINGVSVSFFEYEYSMIGNLVVENGANLASLSDIAAMKCIAVVQRGTKRDFVDMYFLNKMFGLPKIFEWVAKKYPMYDTYHIKTALMYFVEAERDVMPKMLVDCGWEEVKTGLEKAVLSLDL